VFSDLIRLLSQLDQIALEELDRVRAAGVKFGLVVADAGYGSADFRKALSARNLIWAVGVPRVQRASPIRVLSCPRQKVYPLGVRVLPPPEHFRGRKPKHPVVTEDRISVDGPVRSRADHLPGDEVWVVGERRSTGEREFYLTNHCANAPLLTLVTAIKTRWACEQAHQQLKEELGLDHFEGRSWCGLHQAVLVMIAFAFLQHLRLRGVARAPSLKGDVGPPV
jgi:SRSO17 transposase